MSRYLLDADVFIDAHRHYYSFDIHPDFWDSLERKHEEGFVFSIKEVYDELRVSEGELSEWAEKMSMRNFFKEANDVATINKVEELRNWASTEKFTKEAMGEFYGSVDILLVAYAKAHNFIVATNEVYDENIKKRVKIPNACEFIGVEYVNTFQLLGKVGIGRSVIAGYLQKLDELVGSEGSEGNYAYRGQENAEWGVESGAFRRLNPRLNFKNIDPLDAQESFISFHKEELLEPARMDGHGVEEGHELSDLELLAKLQHHGAATCLIDFTRNFLVAMWFACQPHEEKDGKIFILDTSDEENFLSLEKRDLEKEVSPILKFQTRDEVALSKETIIFPIPTQSWWHWSPQGLLQRILKQDSLFIFGQQKIEDTLLQEILQEIKIKHGHKEKILEELDRLGITERTLFKDLPGFADSHGCNKPFPLGHETPKYCFQKGYEALQRGDFKDAMANYDRAVELKPDYAVTYIKRGRFKLSRDDKSGAIADFNRAIKLKPDYIKAYNSRGIVKDESGDHMGAIADFNRAIELNPIFAKAYNNRGFVKAKLGDHAGAIADFNRAIELGHDFAEAYKNRGNAYRSLDRHSDAVADYDRTIKLKPNDAEIYNNRGDVNRILGHNNEAIADFNQAIELKSNYAEAYKNRGAVKSDLGNHRSAIADYDRAIELDPDLAEAYKTRGDVNRILGRDSEAIADYARAIKYKPNYTKAYYNRGLAYDSLGDEKNARKDLLKAQKLAKRSGNERLLGLIDKALSKLDNGNNNRS